MSSLEIFVGDNIDIFQRRIFGMQDKMQSNVFDE